MVPLENGRCAAHCTSSTLSCCSGVPKDVQYPSLEPVPRTSTTISAYPWDGKYGLYSATVLSLFRYGVCTRITGQGHPVVGTYSSESRLIPSRMVILTSAVLVKVVTGSDVPAAAAWGGANRADVPTRVTAPSSANSPRPALLMGHLSNRLNGPAPPRQARRQLASFRRAGRHHG